jgi:hypothetical protein
VVAHKAQVRTTPQKVPVHASEQPQRPRFLQSTPTHVQLGVFEEERAHLSFELDEARVHLDVKAATWCDKRHAWDVCNGVIACGHASVSVLQQRIHQRLQAAAATFTP